jgi:hypothetical protein
MSKTFADIKNDIIVLINNKSQGGVLTPTSDAAQQDYINRMPSLINAVNREIATVYKKIPAKLVLSQYPIDNALPNPLNMFDIQLHTNSDLTFQCSTALAYYFEVDNLSDIYIEEQVNGIFQALPSPVHISAVTKPTGYIAYKGFITPSNVNNPIQIRFSGSYTYRARNIALYNVAFATLSDIPNYQSYNVYTMPDDFFQLIPDGVSLTGNFSDGNRFLRPTDYFWKEPNQILLNYYDMGEYTINYYKYPVTIDDTTADTFVMENTPDAVDIIATYVAAYLLADERPDLFTTYENIYEQKVQRLNPLQDYGTTEIQNVTGW